MMVALLLFVACAPEPEDAPAACLRTYFRDADDDWHGTPDETTTACGVPDGYAKQGDDCDDAAASVHPEAPETCDGIDDDCDGDVDEDAVDASTLFADEDRDGYGLETDVVISCPREGYVAIAGDCDDHEFAVNPDGDELCGGVDEDCDGLVDSLDPSLIDGTIWYVDLDEDGYGDASSGVRACVEPKDRVLDATDCDDLDPDIRPGAVEICDRVDNDCDAMVDDADEGIVGTVPFYRDADTDGLGDPSAVLDACYEPDGYLLNSDDCDDGDPEVGEAPAYYTDEDGDGYGENADPVFTCTPASDQVLANGDCAPHDEAIFPSAIEICDRDDNDCDGLRDDDDPSVVADTWYRDRDGDGYGDPTDTVASCSGGHGYVFVDGDCADDAAATHPGAPEYCDAIDNDCDGTTDVSVVYVDWFADDDGDGFGDPLDVRNDCVQPSGYLLDASDCDDGTATISPEGTEVCPTGADEDCDGATDNCDYALGDADLIIQGSTDAYFCSAMAVADVTADEVADLVFGSGNIDAGHGAVSIVTTLPAMGTIEAEDGLTLTMTTEAAKFGTSVAAGDLDGDAYDDLAIGAPGELKGTTYGFLGPITGDLEAAADADSVVVGSRLDGAGSLVRLLGDHDGDGGNDLAIWARPTITGINTAYVISGGTSGSVGLGAEATYTYQGVGGLIPVGDQNGDGIAEIAVSNCGSESVYVMEGGNGSGSYTVDATSAAATLTFTGVDDFSPTFGCGIAAGDQNGDGTSDLFIGAHYAQSAFTDYGGIVYGFMGPVSGSIISDDAVVTWNGEDRSELIGGVVATGDVDGDKRADVLIAAGQYRSRAYLQVGPVSGVVGVSSLIQFEGTTDDTVGALAFVSDSSDYDEAAVLLGLPTADEGADANGGKAYLFTSEALVY